MEQEGDLSRVWGAFIARHFAFDQRSNEALTAYELDKKIQKIQIERLFLLRMDIDYSFDRFLHDKTKDRGWISAHIEQLSFLILLDLVHPDQITIKDIEKFWQEHRKAGYQHNGRAAPDGMNERNTRRIYHKYYPEVFYFPAAKTGDGRLTPVASIFSIQDEPMEHEESDLYKYLLKIEFIAQAATFGGPHQANLFYETMRRHCSRLRLADPIFVERIIEYRDMVRPYYSALASKFGYSFDRKSIFKEGEPLNDHQIIALYAFVRSAVLLRWFRSLRPEQQDKVVYGKKKMRYTKEDARKAIAANKRWHADDFLVGQILTNGAIAYSDALHDEATSAVILETLIEEVDLDEADLAGTVHNLGTAYRNMGKPKKAITMFNLSMELWHELGYPLNEAIVLASISMHYASESKVDLSRKAFRKALGLVEGCHDSVEKVIALLSLVNCIDITDDEGEAMRVLEEGMRITQDSGIAPKYNAIFFNNWLLKVSGSPYRQRASYSGIPDIARDIRFLETPTTSYIPITAVRNYALESVARAAVIRAELFPREESDEQSTS